MNRLKRNLKKPRRPRARPRAQSAAPRAKDLAIRTVARKTSFIEALRKRSSVLHAAEKAGLGASWCYDERKRDEEFAREWDAALEYTTENLEDSLYERAVEGTRRPVYQGGQLVGHVREFDTTAGIFLLKGRRPEVYRERIEHIGPHGAPVIINVNINKLTTDRLEQLVEILESCTEEKPAIEVKSEQIEDKRRAS